MKWSTEAKVGAFALAGLLIFAGIIMHLSHLVLFGKDGFHVTGYFQEAEGIEPGNPIRYAGVEVGRVDDIAVQKGEAVLTLRFYEGSEVPKDASFSIQTSGVMGGMYVRAAGGRLENGILEEGMSVHGEAAPGFDSAMNKMDKLADSAQQLLDGLNSVMSDRASQENMKNTLSNINALTQNLAILTAQGIQIAGDVENMTQQMNGILTDFNQDGQAGAQARVILDNMAATSENAKALSFKARDLSGKLDGLMSGFRLSGEGELLYNTSEEEFSPNFSFKFGDKKFIRLGVEALGDDSLLNAQYGVREDRWNFYGGMVRGEVGAGAEYDADRWRIGADVYDPNDLTVRIKGGYEIFPDIFATLQTIQPEKRRGGNYIGVSYMY